MKDYSLKLLIIFLIAFPFLIAMIIVYVYFIFNLNNWCYATRTAAIFSQPYEDKSIAFPRYICTGSIRDEETVVLSNDCILPHETPDSLSVTSGSKYLLKNANYHSVRSIHLNNDFAELKIVPIVPLCVIEGIKSSKERSSNLTLQGWSEDCKTTDCVLMEISINTTTECANIPGGLILDKTNHVIGIQKKYCNEKKEEVEVVRKKDDISHNDDIPHNDDILHNGDDETMPRNEF